jgi:hypothetical protein
MSGLGAMMVMSQDAPTPWIRLPKLETRLAIQIARKIRWRKGASVAELLVAGEAVRAVPFKRVPIWFWVAVEARGSPEPARRGRCS